MSTRATPHDGTIACAPSAASATGHPSGSLLLDVLADAQEVCGSLGRADLVARVKAASDRMARPTTLVCVIGDYKQGKSMMIDALVGFDVCPVDDDVATVNFTAVYAAEEASAQVRRTVDGQSSVEDIGLDDLWRFVTERGSPEDRAGLDLVEIGVPGSALPDGLVMIDTPGAGGPLDQHAAATLAYLRLVDAVVFVTDASQPLTAPEMDFLLRAREICSNLLVVVTKIDLYPAWKRIVQLDREQLAASGIYVDPIPVSAVVFAEGHRRELPDLQAESGIQTLSELLVRRVVEGAQERSAEHAAIEARWAIERLREPILAELAILDDPERSEETMVALQAAEERMRSLQGAGSRWSTVLNDRFSDLRTEADHQLRTETRELLADIDRQLEEADPAEGWDEMSRSLQATLARLVDALFARIGEHALDTNEQLADLLLDASPVSLTVDGDEAPGVTEMWLASDRSLRSRRSGFLAGGLTALRGGASGTILLGMMGRLAGMALATPASIGVAVAFGVKQVIDVRKQEVSRRRQEARTVARRFVDELSLEAGNRMTRQTQELHRILRDSYSARVQELSQSTSRAVAAARAAAQADAEVRTDRAPRLRAWLERLEALLDRLPDPKGDPTAATPTAEDVR